MPLALGVALALNSPIVRFKTLARLAFFAPYITSAVVVGWIFTLVFEERYGLLNALLTQLNMEPLGWLRDKDIVMASLIILGLWTWVGYNSLFFLAGLQNVPEELKEAARIDGANSVQVFWNVTLPFLRPVFVFVIITGLIGSFSLFAQPFLLFDSGSGPQDSGLFPLMYLYFMGFQNFRMGYASAIGYLLTFIILIVTGVQLLLFRLWKV
jgi:ABC-type sugar transport system permease subunit